LVTCFDFLSLLHTASAGASVLEHILKLWSKNGPATGRCPTGTGMDGRVILLVAVIVGELFAWGDVPQRDNPDGPAGQLHYTVGLARMIDVAGFVAEDLPVDIIALIELKNIDIPLAQAFVAFGFGNLLASVLDDAGTACDRLRRKEAFPGNTGFADPEQRLHGILACVLAGGRARLCHRHIAEDTYCDAAPRKGKDGTRSSLFLP
jgi:hypothetical protein